jgi:hypothetical protein
MLEYYLEKVVTEGNFYGVKRVVSIKIKLLGKLLNRTL